MEMNFAQRYQLIKELNEQIHAMVTGRTATTSDVTHLQQTVSLQAEMLAIESREDLERMKAAQTKVNPAMNTGIQP